MISGGISQFSGGCIYHFPLFRRINPLSNERLVRALRRYLTRKIGFEAVMRVRCSRLFKISPRFATLFALHYNLNLNLNFRGLSIHTFHGNFFVRSTDLLSLPNVNPDAGFGMQIAIEDSLFELQCVCFQAAVLYTSAKGYYFQRNMVTLFTYLQSSFTINDKFFFFYRGTKNQSAYVMPTRVIKSNGYNDVSGSTSHRWTFVENG